MSFVALSLLAPALPSCDRSTEPCADEERQLIARACAKDDDACRRLFDRHAPAVHRFLGDLLRDRVRADEALQETFVRGFERLSSLRESERLLPWLFGIARNVTREYRRERRRSLAAAYERAVLFLAEPATTSATPETLLLNRESLQRVSSALGQLSEERRAAVLLRFDHALPYEDIARVMGWSLSKAKVEVHRARQLLKSALADEVESER